MENSPLECPTNYAAICRNMMSRVSPLSGIAKSNATAKIAARISLCHAVFGHSDAGLTKGKAGVDNRLMVQGSPHELRARAQQKVK